MSAELTKRDAADIAAARSKRAANSLGEYLGLLKELSSGRPGSIATNCGGDVPIVVMLAQRALNDAYLIVEAYKMADDDV